MIRPMAYGLLLALVLMDVAGRRMDGLSLHYYTLPTGNWTTKGAATAFGEDLWFSTLQKTLRMDELITRHSAIMDKSEAESKPAGASTTDGAPKTDKGEKKSSPKAEKPAAPVTKSAVAPADTMTLKECQAKQPPVATLQAPTVHGES